MPYRNGTYIAFHAEGNPDPTASDIRYYRMLKAWHENDGTDFRFVNSHEKVDAVKDSASKKKIYASLESRLDESKNMVLIIGKTTKDDTDFVPFEIAYAVDVCEIPLIISYTRWSGIMRPSIHRNEWPSALRTRIDAGTVNAIHIPFKRAALDDAISRYGVKDQPDGPLVHYTKAFQDSIGCKF